MRLLVCCYILLFQVGTIRKMTKASIILLLRGLVRRKKIAWMYNNFANTTKNNTLKSLWLVPNQWQIPSLDNPNPYGRCPTANIDMQVLTCCTRTMDGTFYPETFFFYTWEYIGLWHCKFENNCFCHFCISFVFKRLSFQICVVISVVCFLFDVVLPFCFRQW